MMCHKLIVSLFPKILIMSHGLSHTDSSLSISLDSPYDYDTPISNQSLGTKPVVPKHSTIVSNPPGYFAHYHCYLTSSHSPSSVKSIAFPIFYVLSYDNCIPSYKHFFCSISANIEPK